MVVIASSLSLNVFTIYSKIALRPKYRLLCRCAETGFMKKNLRNKALYDKHTL